MNDKNKKPNARGYIYCLFKSKDFIYKKHPHIPKIKYTINSMVIIIFYNISNVSIVILLLRSILFKIIALEKIFIVYNIILFLYYKCIL